MLQLAAESGWTLRLSSQHGRCGIPSSHHANEPSPPSTRAGVSLCFQPPPHTVRSHWTWVCSKSQACPHEPLWMPHSCLYASNCLSPFIFYGHYYLFFPEKFTHYFQMLRFSSFCILILTSNCRINSVILQCQTKTRKLFLLRIRISQIHWAI